MQRKARRKALICAFNFVFYEQNLSALDYCGWSSVRKTSVQQLWPQRLTVN